MTFLKTLGYALAWMLWRLGAGRQGGAVVLTYHSVADPASRFSVSPVVFERQVRWLARHRTLVSLTEVVAHLGGASLPRGAVALTFDDGYRDTLTHALPILKKYGVPATLFLTTDLAVTEPFLGMARPDSWDKVRELARGGMGIEVHGHRHERLTDIEADRTALRSELETSRATIMRELGTTPRLLAYAYGAKSDAVVGEAQHMGFEAAFGMYEGSVQSDSNRFALRRVEVQGTMSFLLFALRTTPAVDVYKRITSLWKK